MHRPSAGFTLMELLIAAAASLILVGLTFMGLVTLQQMNQRREDRLGQEVELQRALNYIAGDIQEGVLVDNNVQPIAGYRGLFRIVRPNIPEDIGYYVAKDRDRVWAGPWIIYRRDFTQLRSYALVDQIADKPDLTQLNQIRQRNQLPLSCTHPQVGPNVINIIDPEAGFIAMVEGNTKVTVCLVGDLPDSDNQTAAFIQATTRSR